MAEAGELRMFKKIGAREQFKSILISLQTTSHPWLTWKDTINNRALNNNTGTIHLSNLCTEICLPQDAENVSVCNLASINLSTHLRVDANGTLGFDWDLIDESARLAVRQLDNLIDITESSVAEADHANEHQPRDRARRHGLHGRRREARLLATRAKRRTTSWTRSWSTSRTRPSTSRPTSPGARRRTTNFDGSRWSQGLVPFDSIALTEADRGVEIKVNRTTRLDWDALRAKVKGGMRNATLMAIAPTASIGLVAGTTPGLDPQFSQIFSRATSNGKFLEVNRNLVDDLQKLGHLGLDARGDPAVAGRHPGHRRDPGRAQGRLQDELPAVAVLVPRGRGPRAEVDRPGDQPQHVPRDARPRRHDGHLLRGLGARRQDDVLPAHEAAPHRRAVDGQGQQDARRSLPLIAACRPPSRPPRLHAAAPAHAARRHVVDSEASK